MTDLLDFTNAREHDLSIRLERVLGPVGSLRLRPAVRWPYDEEWTPEPPVSTWTRDDIARAAAWFARHSAPDEPVSTEGVWFANPAVGFRVIDRDATTIALDVCWTQAPDVPRPTLTGREAVPVGGDDRDAYMTMDMLHATFTAAAAVWAGWDADFR